MRAMLVGFAMICTALVLVSGPNFAQEKKDEPKTVVLKGTITCAKCDLKLEKKLPLNEVVSVDLPTDGPKTLTFQCGMAMYKGAVVVTAK